MDGAEAVEARAQLALTLKIAGGLRLKFTRHVAGASIGAAVPKNTAGAPLATTPTSRSAGGWIPVFGNSTAPASAPAPSAPAAAAAAANARAAPRGSGVSGWIPSLSNFGVGQRLVGSVSKSLAPGRTNTTASDAASSATGGMAGGGNAAPGKAKAA